MTLMKITGKRMTLCCITLSCLVLFGIWHSRHARFTHDKMAELAGRHASRVLDKIDAAPDQKNRISMAAKKIKTEWHTAHQASRKDFRTILKGLLQSDIDEAHYHGTLDNALQRYNDFAHKALDHLIGMSQVLSRNQRTELKERFESAHPFKNDHSIKGETP